MVDEKGLEMLQDIGEAIRAAAAGAGPAVVGIGPRWGLGSGVVVADGQVLTNAHNVPGEAVPVTFADGRGAEAAVAGLDPDGDLAVLAVDTGGVPPVTWGGALPDLGDAVVALANPGGRGLRATLGFVSGTGRAFRGPRGRRIAGAVEHTAPLGRGSSGGPLLDVDGALVGVNTHRLGDGFYLARPADADLRQRVEALARGESPRRPRLGVAVAPPRAARELRRAVGLEPRDGLLVRAVEDAGPAAAAGVQPGDLLVTAAGRDLGSVDDLHAVLDALDEGGTLPLGVVRGAAEHAVEVRLP